MYQVINEAKQNIQQYRLSGTIDGVAFSGEDNVLKGSFNITNQCSDTSTFDLGYVHIGILTATFMNVSVTRNDWKGIEIIPYVSIGSVQDIPLGVFYVDRASHEAGLSTVTAYDAMAKFDKPASITVGTSGYPYDILSLACQECGVTLGMTEEQVQALPNGALPFQVYEQGDIEDWRDVLYWLAKALCSFATIDRAGHLVLRTFHNTVDDTFPADARYEGSSYGDEIITYTGIYINVTDDEVVKYYSVEQDTGYTLSIGSNPFLQGPEAMRQIYADNILAGLANIEYNSCAVDIPFGAHYDLGDVLQFPNGSGSSSNKFCIMYFSWTYGDVYSIRGIPVNKKSMSKTDKNIQGLINNTSKNETTSYEAKNLKAITIADNHNEVIFSAILASNKDTKAMIHIEINLETTANTPAEEYEISVDEETLIGKIDLASLWQGVVDTAVNGEVTYVVNSEEVPLHPTESWIDGKHVLHLMYILGLKQGIQTYFDVKMKATGGSIYIARGGLWYYALGVGLVGDGKWDGTIKVEEEVSDFELIEVAFESASASVTVNAVVPTPISASDTASDFNLLEVSFESTSESLNITFHNDMEPRITEDGEERVTEDGEARYTEGD